MAKDLALGGTFNKQAALYDKIRPHYPDTLFEALIAQTGLGDRANLIEIGPGTGQATLFLAKRGYKITAVEPGEDLATILRRRLHGYNNVRVITQPFEGVDLPPSSFDLVYAATAFHWIQPHVRYTKSHELLKPEGFLAIIHTNHVSDEKGDEFFKASQPIYRKHRLADEQEDFKPPRTDDIKPSELDTDLFRLTFFKVFPLVITYTAGEYAQLLNTFSPVLALTLNRRNKFLAEIRELIEQKFGGYVEKYFTMSLTIAQKI